MNRTHESLQGRSVAWSAYTTDGSINAQYVVIEQMIRQFIKSSNYNKAIPKITRSYHIDRQVL